MASSAPPGLPILRLALLERPGVISAVTGRTPLLPADGDVSYVTGPDPETVRHNRAAWAAALGLDPLRMVWPRQVHGSDVAVVTAKDAGRGMGGPGTGIGGVDALVTATEGLALAITCADCVPLLFLDPVRRAIGVAHAGWRGTVRGIAESTVLAMRDAFGSKPQDLLVVIGPSIGPCCYDVGEDVRDAWEATGLDVDGEAFRLSDGRLRFDLWQANRLALAAAGVPDDQIGVSGLCTRCLSDRFFSHRARVGRSGRFAAIIALSE